ncbi:MAG: hypothetical protein V1716_04055 [Candidatus Uhrbacteria bacterium]
MTLNETYKKIKDEVLTHSSAEHDVDSAILALHESTTKLWQAVVNKQTEKTQPRVGAILLSVFSVMQELGIENPEECLKQKIEELKTIK